MSENQVVIFPRGKTIHIVAHEGLTLCKKQIPYDSDLFNSEPESNLGYCKDCLTSVGEEMLGDFMGQMFFDTSQPSTKFINRTPLLEESQLARNAIKDIKNSLSQLKHRRRTMI